MPTTKSDQTKDPTPFVPTGGESQSQEGQQLTVLQTQLTALQADLLKKEKEAKANQARADRAEQALAARVHAAHRAGWHPVHRRQPGG